MRDWARRVCQLKSVSATKIEKIYRGFISRKLTMEKRKMYQRACVIIQAIIRMYQARIRKMRLKRAKVGFLPSSSAFFEPGSEFLLDYHTPFWYSFRIIRTKRSKGCMSCRIHHCLYSLSVSPCSIHGPHHCIILRSVSLNDSLCSAILDSVG